MTPEAGWVHGCEGWVPGSRKKDEWAESRLRSARPSLESANPCRASDLDVGTCVAGLASSPALPIRAMRACEGRITRRRSWQQSARRDRPAGAGVGHPGAALGDGAVQSAAAQREARAARAVPPLDAPDPQARVAAPAAGEAPAEAAHLADRARRAAVARSVAVLATIRALASGRPIRAAAVPGDRAATMVGPARSR
jgi:hypothetical protein